MGFRIACEGCQREAPEGRLVRRCLSCRGKFVFHYNLARPPHLDLDPARRMWAYADLLPLNDPANIVTLGEGATPLLAAREPRGCRLFWKDEARNPTGSHKDRALSLAISVACELKASRVVIASTGGAGVAAAAYCARAAQPCVVHAPQGTPRERLAPMAVLGARVVEVAGTFAQIETLLDRLAAEPTWYDATTKRSANPFQAEAPKTIAYEIVAQLDGSPDCVVVPVGGGATLSGIWRGFRELVDLGQIKHAPRLVGVQAARFNTLERALARSVTTQAGLDALAMDERVETVARNLKHGVPPDGLEALEAVRASGGRVVSVTDDEALQWQARLGSDEGIFCEPSSATVAAAVDRLARTAAFGDREASVVAIITGSGFRETSALTPRPIARLPADATPADLDAIVPLASG